MSYFDEQEKQNQENTGSEESPSHTSGAEDASSTSSQGQWGSPHYGSSDGERPYMGGHYRDAYFGTTEHHEKQQRADRIRRACLLVVLALLLAAGAFLGGLAIGRFSPDSPADGGSGGSGGTGGLGGGSSINRGELTLNVIERESGVPAEGSIPAVVNSVKHSVVEVRTTTTVNDFYYGNYVQSGAGSGVLINSEAVEGLILTCNHVIEGADANGITIVLADGRRFSGAQVEVLGRDSWSDLALLRIRENDGSAPRDLSYATMVTAAGGPSDYSYMAVGETVIAIGNPLGELGGSVSRGIISAVGRNVSIEGAPMTLMQIDASVNPGNSGGGLFNMDGELIGIVNAKSTGEAIEGIGFAIPTSDAIPLVQQMYQQGYVSGRPFLGLYFNSASASKHPSISDYLYDAELPDGVTIEYGDYLWGLDDVEITSAAVIRAILAEKNVGDTVRATIVRVRGYRQTEFYVDLTLHEYTPEVEIATN